MKNAHLMLLLAGGLLALLVIGRTAWQSMAIDRVMPVASRAVQAVGSCESQGPDLDVFPNGVFGSDIDSDGTSRRVYSSFLRVLGEPPSLYCGDIVVETYRLTCLDQMPLVVTFKRTEDLSLVTTAMSNEPAWKGASAIAAAGRSRRLLSSSEWVMVQNVINDASFWSLQPYQAEACSGGCDAWPWILEGRRGSTYHVATRLYLPSSLLAGSENERFLTASRALLRIAGVDSIRGKRAYARP